MICNICGKDTEDYNNIQDGRVAFSACRSHKSRTVQDYFRKAQFEVLRSYALGRI
jgi:hypothetical protein